MVLNFKASFFDRHCSCKMTICIADATQLLGSLQSTYDGVTTTAARQSPGIPRVKHPVSDSFSSRVKQEKKTGGEIESITIKML